MVTIKNQILAPSYAILMIKNESYKGSSYFNFPSGRWLKYRRKEEENRRTKFKNV